MKKTFFCTLCAILCVILCLPVLSSCGEKNVYELGPYSISREEYAYLMCSYKRQIIESIGLDESYLNYPISEEKGAITYGQYIESMYREQFEQSVFSLLYSQALFDENGLKLTDEDYNSIAAVTNAVAFEFGNGTISGFNEVAKKYGFSRDSLYSVYVKQAKESALVEHLYGDDYSKITDTDKDRFYKDNYIHFQVLVVNTLYQQNSDGTFSNLAPEHRETMLKLEKELDLFLLNEEKDTSKYELLPSLLNVDDMSKVTYEDIWESDFINDDHTYPGGMYMIKPNLYQMTVQTTLSQAMLTQEGDVSSIKAKRYFENEGTLTMGDSAETIKKGDYFEYGTAYIKRLPIDEGAWRREENKDFFGDQSFIAGSARNALLNMLTEYEKSTTYSLMVNESVKSTFSLATIPANYLDYDYLHQKPEDEATKS
ncbi:MAG: hypothetical protein J6B45_04775 [Clostridia bacterium]|nr:hypothetical protein [Clostridia bacterium]